MKITDIERYGNGGLRWKVDGIVYQTLENGSGLIQLTKIKFISKNDKNKNDNKKISNWIEILNGEEYYIKNDISDEKLKEIIEINFKLLIEKGYVTISE